MRELMKDLMVAMREAAVTALCVTLALSIWHFAKSVEAFQGNAAAVSASAQRTMAAIDTELPRIQQSAASAASSLQSTAESTNSTLRAVSGLVDQVSNQVPVVSTKVQTDLDETHHLILESGLTAMEARKASAEERAALPAITAKTMRSLDDLHGELAEMHTTTRDLDALVSNPANARTLKHLDEGTAALAATAKDGQQFTHAMLHPTWPHRVWGVVLDVAHVFNPL